MNYLKITRAFYGALVFGLVVSWSVDRGQLVRLRITALPSGGRLPIGKVKCAKAREVCLRHVKLCAARHNEVAYAIVYVPCPTARCLHRKRPKKIA